MTVKTEERHAQLEMSIPYVFGRLNPGNRRQFEAHLATGCEQCKAELSGLYEATALLPLLLRQESPPSSVRQRILSRISSKKQEPPRAEHTQPRRESVVTPSIRPERSWYLYASVILGLLIIAALFLLVNQLVGTASDRAVKIADLTSELRRTEGLLAVVQGQRLEVVPLANPEAGSNAFGKILWDPATRNGVVQTANLPTASEGSQYQLWMLKANKYISVGVFDVTAAKENIVRGMPLPAGEIQEIEGFVVTLEPRGGSAQPTGAVQLKGLTR